MRFATASGAEGGDIDPAGADEAGNNPKNEVHVGVPEIAQNPPSSYQNTGSSRRSLA